MSLAGLGLVTSGQPANAAPTSVVQPGDLLVLSTDCSTTSSTTATIQLGPAATAAQIGDDPGDQAGPNADAVRWVDPGGTFYASIANCDSVFLISGEGDETVTIFGVDAATALSGIIVATFMVDTSVEPPVFADEPGADTVNVTAGADPTLPISISTGDGDDAVNVAPDYTGLVGVDSGLGNDTIITGVGDDDVETGPGNDSIITRGGNDTINAGPGADTVNSGPGDDVVFGGGGNDMILGTMGEDTIFGQGGDDDLHSGPGNDAVRGGIGDDMINAGTGNDAAYGNDGSDTIRGGPGNDRIRGQANPDLLFGDAGNDLVIGGGGNDTHNGGPEFDRCFEGANQGLSETYLSCEVT